MGLFSKKETISEVASVRFLSLEDQDMAIEDFGEDGYCLVDFEVCGSAGRKLWSSNNFTNTRIFDSEDEGNPNEYDRLCTRLKEAGVKSVKVSWVLKKDEIKRCQIDYKDLADAFGEPELNNLEEAGWKVL
ncbi:MAG: hypothetical protein MJ103_00730 [Saccharofermentans sp.]|nr:hypothetical protein [Saccharofermentans sp.]